MPLVLGVALAIIDTLNTETDPPVTEIGKESDFIRIAERRGVSLRMT